MALPLEIERLLEQQNAVMGRLLQDQRFVTEQLVSSQRQALLSRCLGLNEVARLERDVPCPELPIASEARWQEYKPDYPLLRDSLSDDESEDGGESSDEGVDSPDTKPLIAQNRFQEVLLPVLDSRPFIILVTAMVLTNSVLIGITVNFEMEEALDKAMPNSTNTDSYIMELEVCKAASNILLLAFGVELALRILGEQCQFCTGPHKAWNIFESIVFLGCLVDVLSRWLDVGWLRSLRILRLFRAIRLVRSFKMFKELRVMLFSTVACLQALMWAFLLLFVAFYIFSLYLQLIAINYLEGADPDPKKTDIAAALGEHWNGVMWSIVSLLYSCTGGADWGDLVQPFFEIGTIPGVLYIVFVLFVILGLLNVLVALFVDETREIHRWDREIVVLDQMERHRSIEKELAYLFGILDNHGSNDITVHDLKRASQDAYLSAHFARLDIDLKGGLEAFALEAGADRRLSKKQFLKGCRRLRADAQPGLLLDVIRENKHLQQKVDGIRQEFNVSRTAESSAPPPRAPPARTPSLTNGYQYHRIRPIPCL